ncbi:choline ABC transporter ATP-binding protein [Microvirga tunisiensis]|uniref:Choline ABC transporter ATP-binding protein n=1 Tax=Pannonibacter tanglangensis TaxID=2750084 RepID=A0A7X5F605_9HYPH|nr:choline ABC transporter ATP-binding protein [Pannonibacter sp. XCT-53]NBN79149.1 choline ABC transporter ATP-binding protein [Pannonibacter sp. XCT-53]
MSDPIVSFRQVDIVFGARPQQALPLIDAGKTRREIQDQTGQTLGVAGATFDIQPGEVIVLMGLSGSGKSTLLRAVNGLNPVIRGETLVRDDDGSMVNPARCGADRLRRLRRSRIAMVFQQFALLPWRSVAENVGFGLELAGVGPAERSKRVAAQLELVGLAGWGNKQVHELSGGMQQRVGLARAFATEAPILLMDEPFSALDPLIRDKLQDELIQLQKTLHRTIIFVSHDLDEAAKIGSRIAIMEGGRVIQLGTPQEIVRHPATPYVAEFVAHMNPLNVLRAQDIMIPLAQGRPGADASGPNCGPVTPLREVIALKRAASGPVMVVDNGRTVGQIGEAELLACMG